MPDSNNTSPHSTDQIQTITNRKKKILVSTIGSRGEVQPVLALACALCTLEYHVVICVPPNFGEWVKSFGFEFVPVGVDVQKASTASASNARRKPSRTDMQKLIHATVVGQFMAMSNIARDCDLIIVAGDLNHAGCSIAEVNNIPFIHAIYCPVTLQSPAHPPPTLTWATHLQNLPRFCNQILWKIAERRWNGLFRAVVNEQRALLKLPPINDVPGYIATHRPWLAVDTALAPAPNVPGTELVQTGAWLLPNEQPLPPALEEFLAAGDPPIYFGFGSMRADDNTRRIMLEAARAVGYRAVLTKGWANFELRDTRKDCIVVDEVNHQLLFPRMVAIVHHGGAGTTTTAARAGKPQVLVPHLYDQFYWAKRVRQLGIGVSAGKAKHLTTDKLVTALRRCSEKDLVERSKAFANHIVLNGAQVAAERIRCERF